MPDDQYGRCLDYFPPLRPDSPGGNYCDPRTNDLVRVVQEYRQEPPSPPPPPVSPLPLSDTDIMRMMRPPEPLPAPALALPGTSTPPPITSDQFPSELAPGWMHLPSMPPAFVSSTFAPGSLNPVAPPSPALLVPAPSNARSPSSLPSPPTALTTAGGIALTPVLGTGMPSLPSPPKFRGASSLPSPPQTRGNGLVVAIGGTSTPGAVSSPPPPAAAPPVTAHRTRGLAAAADLKAQVESKGHGLNAEVTVKGGRGGSRIDIAPDPTAPQTIARTIESKSIDLNNYRTSTGSLDLSKLRSAMRRDIQQALKHQQALAQGSKPDLPMRESVVYTVENAKPGEAAQVQGQFRVEATPHGIKGGVVENSSGRLQTASGRPLSGAPAETPTTVVSKASASVAEAPTTAPVEPLPVEVTTPRGGVAAEGVAVAKTGAGVALALAPSILTEVGRAAVQRRFDEAAHLRATYSGTPTEAQIDAQRAVGFEFSGKYASDGSPQWEYRPSRAQIRQYYYHSLFNPFNPLRPQGSETWDGA